MSTGASTYFNTCKVYYGQWRPTVFHIVLINFYHVPAYFSTGGAIFSPAPALKYNVFPAGHFCYLSVISTAIVKFFCQEYRNFAEIAETLRNEEAVGVFAWLSD